MQSNPTATTTASNRRRMRLRSLAQDPPAPVTPSSQVGFESASPGHESQLSPAARRRLLRQQQQQLQAARGGSATGPQHLNESSRTRTRQGSASDSISSDKVSRRSRTRKKPADTIRNKSKSSSQSHVYLENLAAPSNLTLNLHHTPSVDSDDNGTCFNSIGTTTPRHSSPKANSNRNTNHLNQPHLQDEFGNSNKQRLVPSRRGPALSPLNEGSPRSITFSETNDTKMAGESRDTGSLQLRQNNNKDGNSSVYSEFDNRGGSTGRSSTADLPEAEKASKRRTTRGRSSTVRSNYNSSGGGGASVESSRYGIEDAQPLNMGSGMAYRPNSRNAKQDITRTRSSLELDEAINNGFIDDLIGKPNKLAIVGAAGAGTIGAVLLGPVGFLVGAASVGIGMGVMQIPQEQRNQVLRTAASSLENARGIACGVSNNISTQCARYSNGQVDAESPEGNGLVLDEYFDQFCTGFEEGGDHAASKGPDGPSSLAGTTATTGAETEMQAGNAVGNFGDVFGEEHQSSPTSHSVGASLAATEDEDRRVACSRKGRVVPLSQIHSLRPSLQPRAWLDVMASAFTSQDEKSEAMEEILILAKDKEISRWFLEEGILDSLMFILSTYFRQYTSSLRGKTPSTEYRIGSDAYDHAKLAAHCCVALGKAHCASVHTEGDLLLMSAYSRGSVPVERQLAQMLFEVPHHIKVFPVTDQDGNAQLIPEAEFTLTELSMQQSEDLASSIFALDNGKIDI